MGLARRRLSPLEVQALEGGGREEGGAVKMEPVCEGGKA